MTKPGRIATLGVLTLLAIALGIFVTRFWHHHQLEKRLMLQRLADSEKIPDAELLAAAESFLADPTLIPRANAEAAKNWPTPIETPPALKTLHQFRPCSVVLEKDPTGTTPDAVAFLLSNRPLPLVALEVTPAWSLVEIRPENKRTQSRITSHRMGKALEQDDEGKN